MIINFFFRKRKKIKDLVHDIPMIDLRKRIKILVIDDEEDSFPYKALKDDGYTIDWWDKIDKHKLNRLVNNDFDIIILDIIGVVDESISRDGGIGILKYIKKNNKSQFVVAFSGHAYDLSKTEFWKLADEAITKPISLIECKEMLDSIISRINVNTYWNDIVKILHSHRVSENKISKLENEIVLILERNSSFDPEYISRKFFDGINNSAAIVTLIQAMMRIFHD